MLNRKEIKLRAKQLIRTGQVSPLVMGAILVAVSFVLNRMVSLLEYGTFFPTFDVRQYMEFAANGDILSMEALLPAAKTGLSVTFFSLLVSLFITVLSGGFCQYCMGIRQGLQMPYASLLDGLSVAGKLIWCSILIWIKTFLWSMLFVIPGVVAMYRYRFAYYNILTDSSLSAGEAISLSCRQTDGMKMDLFVLDLSFFGWSILSSITMGLLEIWLLPYITLSDLAYFEEGQRRVGRSPYGGGSSFEDGNPWNQL